MLVREVQNNSSFTFGAKFPKGKLKTDDSFFSLHGEMSRQLSSIVNSFNDMFSSLKRFEFQKNDEDAQFALMSLSEKFGIKKVAETVADGITFSKGKKDLIVSTHGVDSIRFREVEPKTGEVQDCLFIHGKRYVKTDTRDNVYQTLQYWRNDEFNVAKFEKELQERFDEVDFDILKVRREMANPEISRILNRASGSEIQAQLNKVTVVKPIVLEPEQVKPKKKILSAYEKMLRQRAEQAVKPHTPSIDFYMERPPIPDDVEIRSKELYLPPVIEKKVSKRGRKPKNREISTLATDVKTSIASENKPVKKAGRYSPKVNAGYLEPQQMGKVNELVESFEHTNELLDSVKNFQTKGRFKKDYPNLIVPKIQGRYNLILTDVSEKYPQVEMNVFKDSLKNGRYLYMLATDINGAKSKIAIYLEDGSVLKKMTPKIAREKVAGNGRGNTVIEYFTQDELNKFDTADLIEPMTEAVKKYSDFIAYHVDALSNKSYRAPNKKGKVQADDATMIGDISSLFKAIRAKLMDIKSSPSRQRVKYHGGMLLKSENSKSSFQGFRFAGGGDGVLETKVSVHSYSNNGEVLSIASKKKDGSIEENVINLDKGYVFGTVPNAVKRMKGSEQKKITPRLTQVEVDKKDFATLFAPLKKLMSEYFEMVSSAVENLNAGKRAFKKVTSKPTETIVLLTQKATVEEVKVAKKRGRPKKVKSESTPKVNIQAEVATFLMNGLKEVGQNLQTLQKQVEKMQKDLLKLINSQNS